MRVFITQWYCLFSFMKKMIERFKSVILYYCICPIIKRRRKKKKTLTQPELKSSSNVLYFMLYFLSFVLNIFKLFKGKWCACLVHRIQIRDSNTESLGPIQKKLVWFLIFEWGLKSILRGSHAKFEFSLSPVFESKPNSNPD